MPTLGSVSIVPKIRSVALPARQLPEPKQETGTVIYLTPPWAARPLPEPTLASKVWHWTKRAVWNSYTQTVLIEIAILAAVAVGLFVLYLALAGFYHVKSQLGIDLLPGLHLPDILPIPTFD